MSPRKRRSAPPADSADIELANLPGLPEGFTALSPTEERRERELEDILEALGTDARVKVWQVVDGRISYAGEVSAEGFSLDTLLDAFGGGEKRLAIMQGRRTVEKTTVFLDPSIASKNPRAPKVVATSGPGGDFGSIIQAMAASQMQSTQTMMTAIGTLIAGLGTVLTATKQTDPLDSAVRIAEVLKPQAAPQGGSSAVEMMSLLREGIKLGEAMNPRENDDGVMGVVSKGMDTLGVLVSGIVEERRTRAAQTRSLPATTQGSSSGGMGSGYDSGASGAEPVASHGEQGAMTPVRPWVDKVRPHIGQLLSAAKFLPPGSAADAIYNMLSDEELSDLLEDIGDMSDGGFGVRLKAYFPGVIETVDPQWIGDVVRSLLEDDDDYALRPGDEPATPNTGTSP